MNLKTILEDISQNENEDIEIMRIFSNSMKDIFDAADWNNIEEDFPAIRKIYENLLIKDDK